MLNTVFTLITTSGAYLISKLEGAALIEGLCLKQKEAFSSRVMYTKFQNFVIVFL